MGERDQAGGSCVLCGNERRDRGELEELRSMPRAIDPADNSLNEELQLLMKMTDSHEGRFDGGAAVCVCVCPNGNKNA